MKRGTLIALLLFAGLIVAAFFSIRQKHEKGVTRLSFKDLDKAAITQIAIENTGGVKTRIEKKDGRWMLDNGKPADAATVERALDQIQRIDTSDQVTSNPDRYAELEVDDLKGAKVELFAGKRSAANFVVGKMSGTGAYIRKGDEVFQAGQFWGASFTRPGGWQLQRLFTDSGGDITRLEVQLKGAPKYALVKTDAAWAVEEAPAGFNLNQDAARMLANSAPTVMVRDVFPSDPGAEKTGLGEADVIAFVGKDGKRRELRLGATDEETKNVYARADTLPEVVAIAEFSAKSLRKGLSDLAVAEKK